MYGRLHPLYGTHKAMLYRCYNPKSSSFPLYGGRGIYVCDRWREPHPNGLLNFVADMGEKPSPQHSVDRIDNDGPYSPENCRWATEYEQKRNHRRNIRVVIDGVPYKAVDLGDKYGLEPRMIKLRAKLGLPFALVVSPKHVPVDNTKGMEAARAARLSRTHCKNGHEWSPENTSMHSGGYRRCKTCTREEMRAIRARKRLNAAPEY